jgi:hypothetical protein
MRDSCFAFRSREPSQALNTLRGRKVQRRGRRSQLIPVLSDRPPNGFDSHAFRTLVGRHEQAAKIMRRDELVAVVLCRPPLTRLAYGYQSCVAEGPLRRAVSFQRWRFVSSTYDCYDFLTGISWLCGPLRRAASFKEPSRRKPHRTADPGAAEAAVAPRILRQVLLVILLGVIEGAGLLDLGCDLTVARGT